MSEPPDKDFAAATRAAELGCCTCRSCQKPGLFGDFLTVQYGGGLCYALCLDCLNSGVQLLIHRTARGIEIVQRARGPVAVVSPTLSGPLTKRTG